MGDSAQHELGRRARALFFEVLEQPASERQAFLVARAGDRRELLEEVHGLLASHEESPDFLAVPALPVGAGHPEVIGPYRIVEILGEGGMGSVYLAEQEEPLRRRVALKVIKLGMDTRGVQARFERERRALAMMDHHGIAKVFDAGTTESGQAYFAMEYVDGPPITRYCEENGLSLPDRLRLFIPVCRAVQHAHTKGILHRDLKPGNVLVATEDGRPRPHVIDFGVARALHPDEEDRITRAEGIGIVGTPDYMSPEQAGVGASDVDARTDVYSLGVLLYELVTGARPYHFDSGSSFGLLDIQRRLEEARPDRPSQHGRHVPPELEWIILEAIAGDRTLRYDTPNELADDLERFLNHVPVVAGPPSKAYLVRKFVRRNARVVAAGLAVLVSLLAGLGVSSVAWWQTKQAKSETDLLVDSYRSVVEDYELQALRDRADELWPVLPEARPRMEQWLREAEELIEGLPYYLTPLEEGESQVLPDLAILRQRRERMASELVALRDDAERADSVPSIRRRIEVLDRLERESLGAAAAWGRAVAALADPAQAAAYGGLELRPQAGLLPLQPDPRSGLWEFLVVGTGAAPERAETGAITPRDEMGIVLVLLPGGTATIGTDYTIGADGRDSSPPPDFGIERRIPRLESPRHLVPLDPFFLGKYEVSAGQWGRLRALTEPHMVGAYGGVAEPLLPRSSISWTEARDIIGRLGLVLPTEAQWEYGTRAGTSTHWWCGDDSRGLKEVGNVFDRTAVDTGIERGDSTDWTKWRGEMWSDGYDRTAPIGSFDPNPFGLHDVHGNVYEWCQDLVMKYGEVDPIPGSGLRKKPGNRNQGRAIRGGSYFTIPFGARSSLRVGQMPYWSAEQIGVRVARKLEK